MCRRYCVIATASSYRAEQPWAPLFPRPPITNKGELATARQLALELSMRPQALQLTSTPLERLKPKPQKEVFGSRYQSW